MIGTWICMLLDGDFSGLFKSRLMFALCVIIGFIAMVRSHIDSSVDLDYKEYTKLLLDKWDWTTRYIAMLNAYDLTDAAAMYVGEG